MGWLWGIYRVGGWLWGGYGVSMGLAFGFGVFMGLILGEGSLRIPWHSPLPPPPPDIAVPANLRCGIQDGPAPPLDDSAHTAISPTHTH